MATPIENSTQGTVVALPDRTPAPLCIVSAPEFKASPENGSVARSPSGAALEICAFEHSGPAREHFQCPVRFRSVRFPFTQEIELLIAIVQSNITGLAKMVDAVSFPSSPSYGQHLTPAQVAEYIKPQAESVLAVTDWFGPRIPLYLECGSSFRV
ncbi:hypothetical protein B0H13DRAFT_2319728 [Mycena leptocephala]|nr:hypothetical protein B0H13DRAFT_2319728 [Mycena leptocephala]